MALPDRTYITTAQLLAFRNSYRSTNSNLIKLQVSGTSNASDLFSQCIHQLT